MCNTGSGKYAAKVAAREAALAAFILNMPDMKNFTQIARDVVTAACPDVLRENIRAYSDSRATGHRVKLYIKNNAKVFGPMLYNVYTILTGAAPSHTIQVKKVSDSGSMGPYLSIHFTNK